MKIPSVLLTQKETSQNILTPRFDCPNRSGYKAWANEIQISARAQWPERNRALNKCHPNYHPLILTRF